MTRSLVARITSRLPWLDPVSAALQKATSRLLAPDGAATPLKDFLNGVWLGHPLHPALTDVPVGAWTATTVFDGLSAVNGSDGMQAAADATLVLGIVGAAGAAAAGIADWSDTSGDTRRTGTLHALLNTVVLSLNIWSWARRRAGHRREGVLLSTSAYGLATVSAYLGGYLVAARGVGVNHQMWPEPTEQATVVANQADLPDGKPARVQAGDVPVCVLRRNGSTVAVGEWCTHLGGPLSEGSVEGNVITCPWHGSQFDLETGAVLRGPATIPVRAFAARVRGGKVEVRAETAARDS